MAGLLDNQEQPNSLKAEIAQLEMQIAQLQAGGMQPSGGVNTAPGFSSGDPGQMQKIYGLMAQYGDNPAQVGQQYVNAMRGQGGGRGSGAPSSIREWQYYNALSEEDKKAYLEMKRGINLQDLAGGQYGMYSDAIGGPEQFTTLGQEAGAATVMKGAEKAGTSAATRYDVLESGRQGRFENYSTAKQIREKVAKKDLPTGMYTGLIYKVLPTADQEKLDALAEFVARARLKASGEIRPTDADVVGMKRALFGSGRTEEFTVDSLERLIRELEAQEYEYNTLGQFLNAPGYQQTPAQVGAGNQQIGQPSPPVPGPKPEMSDAELDALYMSDLPY